MLPNLGQAVRAFGANEREFMTWVTLHEVTHAVQFSGVPWLHGHVAGLVRELLDKAELRLDTPRKLRAPTSEEVRRVAGALRHGDLLTVVTSTAERDTLDRVQAVMAVIEGHAEHVMDAVAPDLLPSLPRLRSALDRRRRSQSGLSRLVARLLGLELKLRQYEQGKFFCDAIVRARGTAALEHVFSGPEALPTLAELDAPAAWLARTMPARARPRARFRRLDAQSGIFACNRTGAPGYKHMFDIILKANDSSDTTVEASHYDHDQQSQRRACRHPGTEYIARDDHGD